MYITFHLYDVSLITYNQYGSDTVLKPALVEVNSSNVLSSPACSPNTLSACCGYGINKVVFNSINNSSLSAVEGYVDFSCENQTTVNTGSSYFISIFTLILTQHHILTTQSSQIIHTPRFLRNRLSSPFRPLALKFRWR